MSTTKQQTEIASVAPSLVRTATPFLVGLLGSVIADAAGLDGDQVGAVVAAIIGYSYYVAARFAEVFLSAKWGYVLGVKGAPTYDSATTDATDDLGTGP